MSVNNVVWVMNHISVNGLWHVFYSGCMDNIPTKPYYNDKYYKVFDTRAGAILYAHDVVDKINREAYKVGFAGVEYGVCIVPKKKPPTDQKPPSCKTCKSSNSEWACSEPCLKCKLKSSYYELKWEQDCGKCDYYGECDHQGAYQKDGKWCYDDGEKEGSTNTTNVRFDSVNYKVGECDDYSKPSSKRKDGCYQFTYCNECLAYPMGLGCPNIVKGPIQLKDEVKNKYYNGETWGKE